MKERISVIIKCLILLAIIAGIFVVAKDSKYIVSNNSDSKLIIYGDTIAKGYNPFVEDGKVYLSFKTIEEFIDKDIWYDEASQKVIITTDDAVYKFKVGDNNATKNLKEYDAKACAKKVGETVYLDMSMVKDIYGFKCEYTEDTNEISIDNLDTSDIHLNFNEVKLYSGLKTNSQIIDTLNTDDTVTVYTESLNHKRWYKVKSNTGKIGYIEKSAVTVNIDKKEKIEEPKIENVETPNEKLITFWQYGSNLSTLGEKIDGVNVVMPTWYSVSDENGSVDIKFNKEYYAKAKSYGYEVWPIITNGFDNTKLDKEEITSQIMNSEAKRENLIRNILAIIEDNRLDGINIDFEGMKDEDKYLYTQFLRELTPVVRETGAKLSADIYFTGYIDRKGVGKTCDYIMLMGYDQRGNWSTKPGSISEINWVDNNVYSLINDSNIDSKKIILGVPFYTRAWKEQSDGTYTTSVYTMKDCADLVKTYGLKPNMDNISGQNYVAVSIKGVLTKVWLEDTESLSKRADIVTKYDLAGIAAWQKGYETDDVWQLLKDKLKTNEN